MKIHLTWIHATAAVAIAVFGSQAALGQYAPYGTTQYGAAPQTYSAPQPYTTPQQYAPRRTRRASHSPGVLAATSQCAPAVSPDRSLRHTRLQRERQRRSRLLHARNDPGPYLHRSAGPSDRISTHRANAELRRAFSAARALQPNVPYPQTAMRTTYPALAQNNSDSDACRRRSPQRRRRPPHARAHHERKQ